MMPPDYTVKIQTISETNGTSADGKFEKQMLVTFMVGTHGPFTQTFPAAGFDANMAKSALAQFAANIRLLAS